MVQDPVCKIILDKKETKYKLRYKSSYYYFCSEHCKDEFLKNPEKYISHKPRRPENSGC